MKIIEQSHEILAYDGIDKLEIAGRTCYQSQNKIGCNTSGTFCTNLPSETPVIITEKCNQINCKDHSSHKFVRMLQNNKHEAMLEFGDITVKFITNRGVTHEIVRHRLSSFAQESTRYCDYLKEIEFILPVWVNKDASAYGFFLSACEESENYYKTLRENGWRPEQAREVLPNSLKTEIIVKTNIREWGHIFKLRCSKAAHPQIRALMLPLLKELKSKIPVVFNDII